MSATRIEKDSLGSKEIPKEAYYGINAARAIENFPISGLRSHPYFIDSFLLIKKAAAKANQDLGLIPKDIGRAVMQACDEILKGALRDQFVVDVFQMGAGTALHMNVNEVLANRAIEILGGEKGDYEKINPNDHVNYGQSTNDVVPTAIRVGVRLLLEDLFAVLDSLSKEFIKKGKEFDDVIKSARTHLQDAVPIRLGQEFTAYGLTLQKALHRIQDAAKEVEELGIGGSAAGTGLNTHPDYRHIVVEELNKATRISFRPTNDLREAMQSQRPLSEVSSALKNLAVELTRICNDLRLLCSGPTTGFAEIVLPVVQAGSSIMPGKVNPSMAEMLNMVSFQIMGHDQAITLAIQAGQLELNVMTPLVAFDLFFSIEILKNAMRVFTERCVSGIVSNIEKCRHYAEMSLSLGTVLNPIIGYAKAAEIVKEALVKNKSIIETIREKNLVPEKKLKELFDLKKLTEPGVHK